MDECLVCTLPKLCTKLALFTRLYRDAQSTKCKIKPLECECNLVVGRTEQDTLGLALQWHLHIDRFWSSVQTLLKHSPAPHFEQSAVLCWGRCWQCYLVWRNGDIVAQILTPSLPQSYKEHVRSFQLPVCICHTWDCLPAPFLMDVLLDDSALLAAPSVFLSVFLGTMITVVWEITVIWMRMCVIILL